MKKGFLIVQPMGGLANRMRVLSFAKYITDKCGSDLKCLWSVDGDLHAPIDSIFKPLPFETTNVFDRQWQMRRSKKWYKNIRAYIWLLLNRVDVWLSYDHVDTALKNDTKEERAILTAQIVDSLRKGKMVYLSTGDYLDNCTDVSFFVPVDDIQDKINSYLSDFEHGHSYGIHIRRTDNTWAIEHSPIELFESKINEIQLKDPMAKFYLATDDAETAKNLCDKFGKCIVYREKEISRTTESGIYEAVIDMWMLANMDEIYGSYWSSFSEVASWRYNKPLQCLCKN